MHLVRLQDTQGYIVYETHAIEVFQDAEGVHPQVTSTPRLSPPNTGTICSGTATPGTASPTSPLTAPNRYGK
jgi:hypothetical protein